MSPHSGPEPAHHPQKRDPAVKRSGCVMRSGVCVSVSALRATTTPTHPAISLVRHRVRFASTSAALRSNAPAALKKLLQCSRQEAHRTRRRTPAFQSACRFPAVRLKGAPERQPSARRSCLQHQRRSAPERMRWLPLVAFSLCRGKPHLRPAASGPSFPSVCLRQPFTPFSPKLS